MRSTLACRWCRKSKVKCSQHDGDKPCKLCVRAGRTRDQCVLEQPPPKSRSPRRQILRANANRTSLNTVENSASEVARASHAQRRDYSAYSYKDEPLFRCVADQMITDVADAFTRKFPELSFVHLADFMQQLRTSPKRILVIKLAAIFALCVRLIESSPLQGQSPRAASQQYATFVQRNIWPQILNQPDVDAIHCLLLIAQYEWGEGNGFATWMYTGMATRMLQGLQARSETSLLSEESASQSDQSRETVSQREIQRRSIWACFIMDRTMSCGKDRPATLHTKEVSIYLPATEDDFDLGIPTSEPLMYSQLVERNLGRPDKTFKIGDYYTVTIRSMDIFAHECEWVTNGGRRQASALGSCPWQAESPWHKIKTEVIEWRKMLHERLQYPQTAVSLYVHRREAERFVYLNLIHYLSVLILYREYLPFIPSYLSEVQGPVEPPLLTQVAPAGWWSEYTTILFDAATQITNLIEDLKAAGILLHTPIVGYSVFSAASMHVFLAAFPWADPRSSTRLDAEKLVDQDLQYLHDFAQIWPLGTTWLQVTRQTQRLYRRIVLEGSYCQYQKDVVKLRKTIEQYGTLSASQPSNENELERNDIENLVVESTSPMASVEDGIGSSYCGTVQDLPSSSSCNFQSPLPVVNPGELHEHHSNAFVNDWSTWGQESLMGQQHFGNTLNFPDLSQNWDEL
ncbi:hypothetical protein COCMIDRAFT_41509 [Bipolaris oryzae ATCC 44560]|uniref:Zn(2)-C6 fungal-type domain-containing protein n=1 Tax=Bipolaris oryzae ATCC 44560 TaxID=930090 RepID=W6YLM3_COCMI|nr:uncharacterized protein COCMIDRAFT_41509 [Bipolaris oryzae ATCC 44560]EUC40107.1 hypothetical protein COCMIDRAFT_41509 [Bipolaris oryzae ATCC 44560]